MYNFLEPFHSLVPYRYIYCAVYKKLCEYNHVFTLNVSQSGELGEAMKVNQKFG